MNDLTLRALAREHSECLQKQAREARSLRGGAARPRPLLRSWFAGVFARVGGACYKLSDALRS